MAGIALLLTLIVVADPDAEAAYADWQALGGGNYAYATVGTERSQPAKERMVGQLAFVCASLSTQSYLGDQLPVKVTENVYRLNLDGLGWSKAWPVVLRKYYPYRADLGPHRYPLTVQASWVVAELPDSVKTPGAAQLLLYGRELKNAKEFRAFHGVKVAKTEAFGYLEGASGVQAEGLQRLMVNYDTDRRTRFFETFDSKIVAGKHDPLEKPILGTLTYDGSELIVGLPKHYNGEGGALQAYFLAQGNVDPKTEGKSVDVAPVDLVKDHEGLRGADIRNHLDCMSCHAVGPQYPTLNGFKQYILGGAKIYADKHTQAELERFYQSPFVKELERQEEDFRTAVRLVNGLTAEKNVADFRACVREYDSPVTLAQAAREVYCKPEELRLAIGHYSNTLKLSARLAMLAEGQAISRDQWKTSVRQVVCDVLPYWRSK
jgi:hypothetical protein